MSVRFDLHVHTRRYSPCSSIDPERLIRQAVKAGLDGLVITEHGRQWEEAELQALADASGEPGFTLLSGFEYSTIHGDLLVYGLEASLSGLFEPGLRPEEAIQWVHRLGGVCVAAHPTRAGMGFDEQLSELDVDALEVCSVNLKEHEQRLALSMAQKMEKAGLASSDAHQLRDVGRFWSEIGVPVRTMADLQGALKGGKFRISSICGLEEAKR